MPDSLLAKANTYANNQWDKLEILFSNGNIDVDNNSTARAIRPITLFRTHFVITIYVLIINSKCLFMK
ncbi:IS66 family transposase [Chitinophaga sancti]|uniref:IS66 family transposase n=1 Tax=Chitinophaga sancti TaxID=1004 RepID=UPI003F79B549